VLNLAYIVTFADGVVQISLTFPSLCCESTASSQPREFLRSSLFLLLFVSWRDVMVPDTSTNRTFVPPCSWRSYVLFEARPANNMSTQSPQTIPLCYHVDADRPLLFWLPDLIWTGRPGVCLMTYWTCVVLERGRDDRGDE
jgi:hypothetical protein